MRIRRSSRTSRTSRTQRSIPQRTRRPGRTRQGRRIFKALSKPLNRAKSIFVRAKRKITPRISQWKGKLSKTWSQSKTHTYHTQPKRTTARSFTPARPQRNNRQGIARPTRSRPSRRSNRPVTPPRASATYRQQTPIMTAKQVYSSPKKLSSPPSKISTQRPQRTLNFSAIKESIRQKIPELQRSTEKKIEIATQALEKARPTIQKILRATEIKTTLPILGKVEIYSPKELPKTLVNTWKAGSNLLKNNRVVLKTIVRKGKTYITAPKNNPFGASAGTYKSGLTLAKNSLKNNLKSALSIKGLGGTAVLSSAGRALDYYSKGEKILSKDFLVDAAIDTGISAASGVAAKTAGAMIGGAIGTAIPIPIVGTVVGATVGMAVGVGINNLIESQLIERFQVRKNIKEWFNGW